MQGIQSRFAASKSDKTQTNTIHACEARAIIHLFVCSNIIYYIRVWAACTSTASWPRTAFRRPVIRSGSMISYTERTSFEISYSPFALQFDLRRQLFAVSWPAENIDIARSAPSHYSPVIPRPSLGCACALQSSLSNCEAWIFAPGSW